MNAGPGTPSLFQQRKRAILQGLGTYDAVEPGREDHSLKGSVDVPLRPLIDALNADPRYVTTSCCSGRVAAFLESTTGKKNKGKLLFACHGLVDATLFDDPGVSSAEEAPGWSAVVAGKDDATLRALFSPTVEAAEMLQKRLFAELQTSSSVYGSTTKKSPGVTPEQLCGVIWLNVEPFVIHVECQDLHAVSELLGTAIRAGLKNSGLMLFGERLTVALRGSQRLHTPIFRAMGQVPPASPEVEPYVNTAYLQTLLQFANERMLKNWSQIHRYAQEFSNSSTGATTDLHHAMTVCPKRLQPWTRLATPHQRRVSFLQASAVVLDSRTLLLLEGIEDDDFCDTKGAVRSNTLSLFTMKTNSWDQIHPESGVVPLPRVGSQLVSLESSRSLLLVGGFLSQTVYHDVWLLLREASGWHWREVALVPSPSSPSCCPGRFYHAVAHVPSAADDNDAQVHTVFVYGGVGEHRELLDDFWRFDITYDATRDRYEGKCTHVLQRDGVSPGPLCLPTLWAPDPQTVVLVGGCERRLPDPCHHASDVEWRPLTQRFAYNIASSRWELDDIPQAMPSYRDITSCITDGNLLIMGTTLEATYEFWILPNCKSPWVPMGQLQAAHPCCPRSILGWNGASDVYLFGNNLTSSMVSENTAWKGQLTMKTTDVAAAWWVAVATLNDTRRVKTALERARVFDAKRKIKALTTHVVPSVPQVRRAWIPIQHPLAPSATVRGVSLDDEGHLRAASDTTILHGDSPLRYITTYHTGSRPAGCGELKQNSSTASMYQRIEKVLDDYKNRFPPEHRPPVPRKWERLGDIVLLVQDPVWDLVRHDTEFWQALAEAMKCRAVGLLGRVAGEKRVSQVGHFVMCCQRRRVPERSSC